MLNMPMVRPSDFRMPDYEPKFRIAEMEAVAAALREDLPKEWTVMCVGGSIEKKKPEKKKYEPGYRWIAVIVSEDHAFDVSLRDGEISTRIGQFNSIVIPLAQPDALECFAKRLHEGILNHLDAIQVGN